MRISAHGDAVTVTVTNPVSADDAGYSDSQSGGFGLTGIRERVASIGGTVSAHEDKGTFTLVAHLPFRREDRP